ncbi:hypothetical protein BX661DRAFT_203686 [Kickxella alabastrina]|uniref:uncharacterized protein n=1 Tax=Kickxella alabastrina TaxID=61397 RepID=UPI002220AE84|nr:uncharacterized protein BX661DRAFT_203686 [Kickxella alabastrina]KAI7833365.1 hypothetical protein BX661DRAFT_203686 [Kickxella alabastrina]
MYAGQVDVKDVVCNVLVPLLRQMESMYLSTLDLAFYPISDSDEALSEVAIAGTRLGQQMSAVLVLFSAMQVVAAQQGIWMDSGVLVFDVLRYFQLGLLGHLAAYFRYAHRLDADLMKSLGIWSSTVNMGVEAVVVSYYMVVGEEDDAHCRACIKLVQLPQEHKICMEDISIYRFAARWQTGAEMFNLAGNDMGVDGIGNVELVVNRSGSCGTATDHRFTEVLKPAPALDSLILHFRIKLSPAAAAIVDNAAAVADEPHLLPAHQPASAGRVMLGSVWGFPESGEGVRHNLQSISYDGMRICKWYGTATVTATLLALSKHSNQYGEKWEAGDVIGT